MANIIKLKQSSVSAKVPLPADLVEGELALNTADVKLYSKDSSGEVIELTSAYRTNRMIKAAAKLIKTQRIMLQMVSK